MATAPNVTEIRESKRPPFEFREADLGKDTNEEICHWLDRNIESLEKQLEQLHKNKAPEWRRVADGKPREENKSWPWPNCSNLVHQLVGETIDESSARVLQLIYALSPIIRYMYFTKSGTDEQDAQSEKKSRLLEQFMEYVSLEPTELNLYSIENIWFSDSARLGTSWADVLPFRRKEAVYAGNEMVKGKSMTAFEEKVLYEGPKIANPRFEDILADPNQNCLEECELVCRRMVYNSRKLREASFRGELKASKVTEVLEHPDRHGPTEIRKRENQRKGITSPDDLTMAEWDIYRCHFCWWVGAGKNAKKISLIAWFHKKSKTVLNQIFNVFPDNALPIIRTRLSSNEGGLFGKGYAEMLKDSQDEISTRKNQRGDSITMGMLGINRVSPQNRNIDRNFQVYPGAAAPFGKDEFEHYDVGNSSMTQISMQDEAALIQQAKDRAGIAPPLVASGAGGMVKKGVFGSMGTLSLMSDGNTRTNHRVSDFRYSHVKLMGLLTAVYGAMGLGKKGSLFGLDDKLLTEALEDYLGHRVRIPIRAVTASANKEVEKQNDILLAQALRQQHVSSIQLLQAMENPNIPPDAKDFFMRVIKAQTRMFTRLMRNFGYDEPDQYVPEPKFNAQAQGTNPILQMAGAIPTGGQGGAAIPPGGVAPAGAGLPNAPGNAGAEGHQ